LKSENIFLYFYFYGKNINGLEKSTGNGELTIDFPCSKIIINE
jgi:hypothetical protein